MLSVETEPCRRCAAENFEFGCCQFCVSFNRHPSVELPQVAPERFGR